MFLIVSAFGAPPYQAGHPGRWCGVETSRQPDCRNLTIQAGFTNTMSNRPKYYFRDIPADVMKEIMDEMQSVKPEPDIDEMLEALDRLNRSTVAETIPAWHESVGQFLSDIRYEYR